MQGDVLECKCEAEPGDDRTPLLGCRVEPGHAHRSYQLLHTPLTAESTAPEIWQRRAPRFTGSWWPAWHEWLRSHGGAHVAAREISPVDVLEPAPGSYVQVRYGD